MKPMFIAENIFCGHYYVLRIPWYTFSLWLSLFLNFVGQNEAWSESVVIDERKTFLICGEGGSWPKT